MSSKPQYRPVRDIKNYHYHHPGEVCAPALVGYACFERERMKNKEINWDSLYRDQLNSIVHCGLLNFIDIGPAERKLKKKYPDLVEKQKVGHDDSYGYAQESQKQQQQQKQQEQHNLEQLQMLKREEERIKLFAQIEAQNLIKIKEEEERIKLFAQIEAQNLIKIKEEEERNKLFAQIDKEKQDEEEFKKAIEFAGDDQYYVQQRQLMLNFEQQYQQKAQQEKEQSLLKQKIEDQWPQFDSQQQQILKNEQFQEYNGNKYINVSQITLNKGQFNQIEEIISSIKNYSEEAIQINEDIQVKILPNNSRIIQKVKGNSVRLIDGQRFRDYTNLELSDQTIIDLYMVVCDQAADKNQDNNVYQVGNLEFKICADDIINIKLLK